MNWKSTNVSVVSIARHWNTLGRPNLNLEGRQTPDTMSSRGIRLRIRSTRQKIVVVDTRPTPRFLHSLAGRYILDSYRSDSNAVSHTLTPPIFRKLLASRCKYWLYSLVKGILGHPAPKRSSTPSWPRGSIRSKRRSLCHTEWSPRPAFNHSHRAFLFRMVSLIKLNLL